MTTPLAILAFFAVALGIVGTPACPWFSSFLNNQAAELDLHAFGEPAWLMLLLTSCVIVAVGIGLGWLIYGNKSPEASAPDTLQARLPAVWTVLENKFYIDELYGATFIVFYAWWARVADWIDRYIWGGAVNAVMWLFGLWARLNRFLDANVVDGTFDKSCEEISTGGGLMASIQSGVIQNYLRILALAVVALVLILFWSSRP
jgi:NADH-quinone oxidoreductase subunit L